jgi:outer membrane protein OmpA-like peptidoglycan-associated protein
MSKFLAYLVVFSVFTVSSTATADDESWEEFTKLRQAAEQSELVPKGSRGPQIIPKDVIVEQLTKPNQGADSGSGQGPEVVFSSKFILFDFGSSRLRESSYGQLREIADALKDPKLSSISFFYVDGYTCDIGSDANNCRLSWDRARSVVDYLTSSGNVPREKVKARGFGESSPMYPNTDEENRSKNRRVALRVGTSETASSSQPAICSEEPRFDGGGGSYRPYSGSDGRYRPQESHSGGAGSDSEEPLVGGIGGMGREEELPAYLKGGSKSKDQKSGRPQRKDLSAPLVKPGESKAKPSSSDLVPKTPLGK